MDIDCVLFGPLREAAGDKEVTLSLQDGATVDDVLTRLARTYEGIDNYLATGDGGIPGGIIITVNKRHVTQLDGAGTTLADGDTVRVTPSIQGG